MKYNGIMRLLTGIVNSMGIPPIDCTSLTPEQHLIHNCLKLFAPRYDNEEDMGLYKTFTPIILTIAKHLSVQQIETIGFYINVYLDDYARRKTAELKNIKFGK